MIRREPKKPIAYKKNVREGDENKKKKTLKPNEKKVMRLMNDFFYKFLKQVLVSSHTLRH